MINYKEFREFYSKLPKNRICQKQGWDSVAKTLEKEEKHNLVLIARSPSQPNFKSVWFLQDGTTAYNFNINEEGEYSKGEKVDDIQKLNMGAGYQYSLARLKFSSELTGKKLESLFELHRQGSLPDKLSDSHFQSLFETKKGPRGSMLAPKQRIVNLFCRNLKSQLEELQDAQLVFQRAREELEKQLGDEEQVRLFQAMVPLWEKLFCAFSAPTSAKTHVQFYTMHILPIFSEVQWPGE